MGEGSQREARVEPIRRESAEELYENAPCGYLSTLPDGTIARVNRTFLTWTGYLRDDLVGRKHFADLLSAGGRIYHETHYAPLLRMQGTVREIALELVCADGRRLPVLVNSTLEKDDEGQPIWVRTTIFDATARRQYELELLRARRNAEAADRAKAEFISTVSHEIRTPLGAIMAAGHLLETTELSPQQQKYLRILRSSSENLLGLIDDILDFSKIEAGRVTLDAAPFAPAQLVAELAHGFDGKAEERGLVLEVEIDERLPDRLIGDAVKIRQVLGNLLSNAIKFTTEGAVRLSVEVREEADQALTVAFAVVDTGIGIAADRIPHVFDDFTQASSDIGAKYGGTGLGLAISQRLVDLHGGRIEVESEPGRGSNFSFELVLDRPQEDEAPSEAPPDRELLRGLRALIADDNDINRFTLGTFLERWGVEYDAVADGKEAVSRVQANDYDVVLMDLRMPEIDGLTATRQIRALGDERYTRLPIIAVSASVRMGEAITIDESGFTAFVGKPIRPDQLFRTLADCTGRG